jgi:hypothetical protein
MCVISNRSARLARPIKEGYNADLLRFATAVAMHGDRQQIRLTGPRGEYQCRVYQSALTSWQSPTWPGVSFDSPNISSR